MAAADKERKGHGDHLWSHFGPCGNDGIGRIKKIERIHQIIGQPQKTPLPDHAS